MKTVAIIEARMNSKRLPGKVMKEVLGEPLIGHLINRLKKVSSLDDIILATTNTQKDNVLSDFAINKSVKVFRGSENDVLKRVASAANKFNVETIVSISGDCPMIDPDIVEQTIRVFKYNNVDYVANSFYSSYPDGMDTQVFSYHALKKAEGSTDCLEDREHVTRYIVNNPKKFSHFYLTAPPSLYWPGLGLIVDEDNDFKFVKTIFENLGKNGYIFSCIDIINFLKKNPSLLKVNKKVIRKNIRPL